MSSEFSTSETTPRASSAPELSRIGKYQIIRRLGAGGMGIVYLASDSELKRTVALKVLSQDRANNPTLVRRFKSEGQAAALLQHKNIVSVYEAGQADGYLFLALEYVDGIDLLEWVNRRGPVSVKRSVEIIRQAAEALQHAYERNIVHRDIKPSNLMITRDGTVKLTDMGLARSIDESLDTTITRDGTTVGTVDYMAPEQASNSKAADIRSDIYSLGCTWYHLLVGHPPYPEGSVTNKISAHVSSPLPDPRVENPNVTEAIVAVIHRMLAKKKEQRYQTPRELLDDLASPALKRSDDSLNLLAMFEDDLAETPSQPLESSEDLIFVRPGQDTSRGKGTADTGSRGKKLNRKKDFYSMPTRAEIPTSHSANARQKLRRLDQPDPSRSPSVEIPWGLLILGGIAIAVVLAIRIAFNIYFPTVSPSDHNESAADKPGGSQVVDVSLHQVGQTLFNKHF